MRAGGGWGARRRAGERPGTRKGRLSSQALYDHLMDFLADRGVDNTFADELVELSTALEHQEYIAFLEDLKGFVKTQ